jgi:hypothetical protein
VQGSNRKAGRDDEIEKEGDYQVSVAVTRWIVVQPKEGECLQGLIDLGY